MRAIPYVAVLSSQSSNVTSLKCTALLSEMPSYKLPALCYHLVKEFFKKHKK